MRTLLCNILLFLVSLPAMADDVFPLEQIYLSTDKSIYFGGDTIWVRALCIDALTRKPLSVSKYVYVCLIDEEGKSLTQVKLRENQGSYSGYIRVAPEVTEGDYGLSAYTLLMANAGNECFAFKNVKLLTLDRFRDTSGSDSNQSRSKRRKHDQAGSPSVPTEWEKPITPTLTIDKPEFGQREKVTVTLDMGGPDVLPANLTVSVTDNTKVPLTANGLTAWTASLPTTAQQMVERLSKYKDELPYPLEVGQEINGRVKNVLGKRMKNAPVSIISTQTQMLQTGMTDEHGNFSFQGFDNPEGTAYVLQTSKNLSVIEVVEQSMPTCRYWEPKADFFPSEEKLSQISKAETKRINSNAAIREYMLEEVVVTGVRKNRMMNVYQALSSKTYTAKDIKEMGINHLEELLRYVPGVVVADDVAYFRTHTVAFMIDGVLYSGGKGSLFDMSGDGSGNADSEMSKISLTELETKFPFEHVKAIDFIPSYMAAMFGPVGTWGGLLVITTGVDMTPVKKELPNVACTIPMGYQKPRSFYSPDYSQESGSAIDHRSTLYWNPNLVVGSDGKACFSFFTSDAQNTTYTLRVEGLTASGSPVYAETSVTVR